MAAAKTEGIDIFLRVRPVEGTAADCAQVDEEENLVRFTIPRLETAGPVNNQREKYHFKFDGILGSEAKQDEVFERTARKVVASTLEGRNGTIFAYGQTGSGKTFTVTGGAERYVDRGLIPRTLSAVFEVIRSASDRQYSVYISYMEIYNDTGYDLLDPRYGGDAAASHVTDVTDLPKVQLLEDDDNRVHLRNLSEHRAITEEEALNLLFLGDTNRIISETPMNLASSRSHCIFSVNIESRAVVPSARRPAQSESGTLAEDNPEAADASADVAPPPLPPPPPAGDIVVRRSKLSIVDLAGSERVAKTRVEGQTLREAKYINSSLHFLEQVIIALQARSQGRDRHIPYRNSLMTSVLRDSLGGNCKTRINVSGIAQVMIATIDPRREHLHESVSTCRFAQRVAMIENTVLVNEEIDPKLLVKRLKQEIRMLKEEIRFLKGEEEDRGPLTEDERLRLRSKIESYVNAAGTQSSTNEASEQGSELVDANGDGFSVGASMMHIRAAFAIFKDLINAKKATEGEMTSNSNAPHDSNSSSLQHGQQSSQDANHNAQIRKMKHQIRQRDNEINILVSIVRNLEAKYNIKKEDLGRGYQSKLVEGKENSQHSPVGEARVPSGEIGGETVMAGADILANRQKAFELFRKSYGPNDAIEAGKVELKDKYAKAKQLGREVTETKERIGELKSQIEKRRLELAVQRMSRGEDGIALIGQDDPVEAEHKGHIEDLKKAYRGKFESLRGLKNEIEHQQMMLEQSRARLQSDFESWMRVMQRQHEKPQSHHALQASTTDNILKKASQSSRDAHQDTREFSSTSSKQIVERPMSASRLYRSAEVARAPGGMAAPKIESYPENDGGQASWAAQPQMGPKRKARVAWADMSGKPLSSSMPLSSGNVNLLPTPTGNSEADADIQAFYAARDKLLAARNRR